MTTTPVAAVAVAVAVAPVVALFAPASRVGVFAPASGFASAVHDARNATATHNTAVGRRLVRRRREGLVPDTCRFGGKPLAPPADKPPTHVRSSGLTRGSAACAPLRQS